MTRGIRIATIAVVAAAFMLTAAASVDPVGTTWLPTLVTKLKIGKDLDNSAEQGGVFVLGPDGMVSAGRFYVEITSGLATFTGTGTYSADSRGRLAFEPDRLSIAMDLLDRLGATVRASLETELGGPLDGFGIEITGAAVKAKVKEGEPSDVLSLSYKVKMLWTGRIGEARATRKGLLASKGRGPQDV